MKKYVIVRKNYGDGNWYTAYKKFIGLFYVEGYGKIKNTTAKSIEECKTYLAISLKYGIVEEEF
jgi:hypothetical protein